MVGKIVSHYRVLRQVGSGGMGVVYEAEDLRLGRHVALKFLPEDFTDDKVALERFHREARAVSALNHPNICTIHDIDQHDGHEFMVMELLEGHSLRDLIADKPLPLELAITLAIQMADGIEAAHEASIIHRDLKPANIFVTNRHLAKILDFGLAKVMQRHAVTAGSNGATVGSDELTGPGSSVGTVAYMSPEQARGEELDARTDVFSMGAVLYEMTTGKAPFAGTTSAVVFDAILNRDPVPATQRNPEIPHGLERIMNSAMEKNVDLRCQSAANLRADLKRLQREIDSGSISARSRAAAEIPPHPSASSRVAAAIKNPKYRVGMLGGVILLLVLMLGFALVYTTRARALTEKDQILIAEFANTTGDPVFDRTLRKALEVDLDQSPFLNVVREAKIRDTLKLMERPANERLTTDVAREICQRIGTKAVLAGSISNIGSQYVLTLEAMEATTGASISSVQQTAMRKEDVLAALGKAATQLRTRLGEASHSVEKYDKPLPEATTSSLEALKAFTDGDERVAALEQTAAIPHFVRATELDPNFALAYARLGVIYHNMGQFKSREEAETKAFELSERVSERERLYIAGHYYSLRGDLPKCREIWEQYRREYPRDRIPVVNLSTIEEAYGNWEKSVELNLEVLRMDPDAFIAYSNAFDGFVQLNRFDEARNIILEAQRRKLGGFVIHRDLALLALLRGDHAVAEDELKAMRSTPQGELMEAAFRMEMLLRSGQIRKFRAANLALEQKAIALGLTEERENMLSMEANVEAVLGFRQKAIEKARRALGMSSSFAVRLKAASALEIAGESKEGERIVNGLLAERPEDTMLHQLQAPTSRAMVLLNQKRPEEAIAELQAIGSMERNDPAVNFIRGRAHLAANRPAAAIVEFEKVLARKDQRQFSIDAVLAKHSIARSYAAAGETQKARAMYKELFAEWKDADPDIPMLNDARAEFAKLH